MSIPLVSIDYYWWKLDMAPLVSTDREVVDELDLHLAEEIEMVRQCFVVSNDSEKMMFLKRLRELGVPNNSSLMEPEVKIRKCFKRIPMLEASTCRFSSKFELVESAENSCSTATSKILMQACPEPIT